MMGPAYLQEVDVGRTPERTPPIVSGHVSASCHRPDRAGLQRNAVIGRSGSAAVLALILLSTAGCSTQSDAPPAASSGSTTAITVENCGRTMTFDEPPSRVVILNGASVAEVGTFVALGLEDRILANVQSYGVSDDPALAGKIAELPTGGLTINENFDVPAEQLLALAPDLVVSTSAGGFDKNLGFATRDELAAAGANTLVTPANCASGNADATPEEQDRYATAGVDASFELLRLVGEIFQVEERAEDVVDDMEAQLSVVEAAVENTDPVRGIIVFPGMSAMSSNGLPAVMTGGIYDDVLARAGVTSAFAGASSEMTSTMTAEQLAAADIDVLVLAAFTADEDLDAEAAEIFAAYPDWPAARANRYAKVSDGVYLGPTNAIAVEKIARVAHPDAF